MLSVVCTLLLLELVYGPSIARAQSLPPIACPQFFQYLSYGDFGYIGKITIPNLRIGRNRLDVKFVRHKALIDDYTGNLTLFESIDKTKENLAAGIPIMYRVDFPRDSEVPKLISLVVNGNEICAAMTYSGDKQTLTMSNVMTTFESITRKTRPIIPDSGWPRILDDPFPDILGAGPFGSTTRRPIQLPAWRDLLPETQLPVQSQPRQQPQAQPQPQPKTQLQPQFQPQPQPQPQPEPQPLSSRALNEECGILDQGYVSPFIYGGREVIRGEYPWLVALFRKYTSGTGSVFSCAGSLISTRTVITAAHCFFRTPPSNIVAYVGKHNFEIHDEEGVEPRDLADLIPHPNYNQSFIADADVMILILQRPVTFSLYVRPICLWPASEPTVASPIQTTGYVAGWGADETGRKVTSTPKAVDINVVDNEQCLSTSGIYKKVRSLRTFCAGNEDNTGPCKGDSGSAFAIRHNDRWTLRGIVSVGQSERERCILDKYVIFCDVTKHISWVRSNMLL